MAWIQKFHQDGFCVIENFLKNYEVNNLKRTMDQIVDRLDVDRNKCIFTANSKDDAQMKERYFLESVDKIRYFYEEGALDNQGNLAVPKQRSLNKVGHALHMLNNVFHETTFSEKIQNVFRTLNFQQPVVPQSMYIFKQPGIGGAVCPHVDASFLLCDPPGDSLVGVWLALDEATRDNGCLWFVPGSHQGNKVTKKFVRNPPSSDLSEKLLKYEGDVIVPDRKRFVPAPAPKGSLVLIHGLVWHMSEPNKSDNSRHAYAFHVVDEAKCTWDCRAWLQPTPDYEFPSLYDP